MQLCFIPLIKIMGFFIPHSRICYERKSWYIERKKGRTTYWNTFLTFYSKSLRYACKWKKKTFFAAFIKNIYLPYIYLYILVKKFEINKWKIIWTLPLKVNAPNTLKPFLLFFHIYLFISYFFLTFSILSNLLDKNCPTQNTNTASSVFEQKKLKPPRDSRYTRDAPTIDARNNVQQKIKTRWQHWAILHFCFLQSASFPALRRFLH